MEYIAKAGDIFLCDSDRFAAKMVKFLMQSPTVWQQIWRFITRKLEPVRYYHAGMIIDSDKMIEQQGKVQFGETQKILSRDITIYRKKSLTDQQRLDLVEAAVTDLGEVYGVMSVFGKLFTWLTGINWFVDVMHIGDTDICINRVAYWYSKSVKELFGLKNFKRNTTKIMDEYCSKHPEDWEIVYTNTIVKEGGKKVSKKIIGIIMMVVGGITAVIALGLLIKWYPIQVATIVTGVGLGFGGYLVYKKG
jgi:hypothetical protein